jgi:hypothetical protein
MASTKTVPNQYERDYRKDPEYLGKYKMYLDQAMDSLDMALTCINTGRNTKLQREILHIKYCISLFKDNDLPLP